MSKQIRILQTLKEAKEFKAYCSNNNLKFYEVKKNEIKLVQEVSYNDQYYLSICEDDVNTASIEYDMPQIYNARNQKEIISCGRIFVNSNDKSILEKFECLRKFIRKNYIHIDDFWFGQDIVDKVKNDKIISATNFGTLQIINSDMTVVLKDTWLKNRRFVDGEWLDNSDIRYYKK